MSFDPTPEQAAICDAAANTSDNLIVNAYAGAAKTSTLVLLSQVLAPTPILALAFNAKIAKEMNERLPSNCEARTLNSLGHRTFQSMNANRLKVDKNKVYGLVKDYINEQPIAAQDDLKERFSDYMRAIDFGSQCGFLPDDPKFTRGKGLMSEREFFDHYDERFNMDEEALIVACTIRGIKEAFRGHISFNDQIFMPTIFPCSFPAFPVILVDEAQDLSALNHAMLQKLVNGNKKKPSRVIAVGDECQAIYGFRGAHQDSMRLLRETFSMKPLPLTISFRCPKAVVEEARWRAPDMKSPEWAVEGAVNHLTSWGPEQVPENTAIICSRNAPLFRTAIRFLASGVYAELESGDVAKPLLAQMAKWKKRKGQPLYRAELLQKITDWENTQHKRKKNVTSVRDKAACMRIFAEQTETLEEALQLGETILSRKSNIRLMTGHKSKGLEFPHVFFLDEEYLTDDAQDPNVRYVIQTRAQQTLTYVRSEGWTGEDTRKEEE